jgi:hypothetical protein
MLGEANPFRGSGRSGPTIPNVDGGIKVRFNLLPLCRNDHHHVYIGGSFHVSPPRCPNAKTEQGRSSEAMLYGSLGP